MSIGLYTIIFITNAETYLVLLYVIITSNGIYLYASVLVSRIEFIEFISTTKLQLVNSICVLSDSPMMSCLDYNYICIFSQSK